MSWFFDKNQGAGFTVHQTPAIRIGDSRGIILKFRIAGIHVQDFSSFHGPESCPAIGQYRRHHTIRLVNIKAEPQQSIIFFPENEHRGVSRTAAYPPASLSSTVIDMIERLAK